MDTGCPAPIAVFAYRRADHLAKTLDALELCPEFSRSPVFAFSDGARNETATADVQAVRTLLRKRKRDNMTIVEATSNQGLAASIISGVNRLCSEYGRVIVIEDDLVLTPSALTWMNAALDRFADDDRVYQVSAYQWWNPRLRNRRTGLFGRLAVSWGWGTWKRAWDQFDPEAIGADRLETDPDLRRAFDMGGSFPLSEMMVLQSRGLIDSWAIRWAWSVFKNDGLVVFPPQSLVRNIGFDKTATHNSIGRLKALITPSPDIWEGPGIPELPDLSLHVAADERTFEYGLRRSGAMRNRKVVAVLRAMGLWRKN
jgi:hypothetical protein